MYTDFGYMEEGKLGKPYDLRLMARLGVFSDLLVPDGLSLLFVLIMAALDLFIPYLTKEAIDRYIVVSAREVVLKGDGISGRATFLESIWKDLIPKKDKGHFLLPARGFAVHGSERDRPFSKNRSPLGKPILPLCLPQGPQEDEILRKYTLPCLKRAGPTGLFPLIG